MIISMSGHKLKSHQDLDGKEARTGRRGAAGGAQRSSAAATDLPDARRQEIINAAAAVIDRKGYDGATIQEVADAVGILKGSLYHYIKSKEDLLYWATEDWQRRFSAILVKVDAKKGDARERLAILVREHIALLTTSQIRNSVFSMNFRRLSEPRRSVIATGRRKYEQGLVDIIRQGQREGSMAADLDASLCAKAIFGMLNWTFLWFTPKGRASVSDVSDLYLRLILNGLLVDVASKPKSKPNTRSRTPSSSSSLPARAKPTGRK